VVLEDIILGAGVGVFFSGAFDVVADGLVCPNDVNITLGWV